MLKSFRFVNKILFGDTSIAWDIRASELIMARGVVIQADKTLIITASCLPLTMFTATPSSLSNKRKQGTVKSNSQRAYCFEGFDKKDLG